jgi:hypothetical protein
MTITLNEQTRKIVSPRDNDAAWRARNPSRSKKESS